MTILPTNRFIKCSFYAPIQIAEVRLEGEEILGPWGDRAKDFYGERGILLAQRFANWPAEPNAILQFTKRYGPLIQSPSNGDMGFRFSLQEWQAVQTNLRNAWKSVMKRGADVICPDENMLLEIRPKQLVLQCTYLRTFMYLELSTNSDKLRLCEREECTHPYFVPQHGKERYCSTTCSSWAQSQWKRRWHERQREKRNKKEKPDVTSKTR